MSKEPRYIITEMELKMLHMAAVIATGENKDAQNVIDEIRKREILWKDKEDNNASS